MVNIERRKKYSKLGHTNVHNKNKIKLKFDLEVLTLMCCYILSENQNIRRSHLINMRNLFDILDMDIYLNDSEKMKRINFIRKGLEGRLQKGLINPYLIIKYINGGIFDDDIIDPENLKYILSTNELDWINQTISQSLKYLFMHSNIDNMIDLCARFKSADYHSISTVVEEFEELIDVFKAEFRRNKVESSNEITFSLQPGVFENNIMDIHQQLTHPSSRLYCGMQGVNELFGGGLENGRCYFFFGMSGTFKSGLLLTIAYQIKKYNKNYICKDPSKRPAIVLLTMENTIKETVERLFNLSTVSEDIRSYDPETVIKMLQQQGELYITDDSPIDIIIKYKPNGSVDTGYLYTLVEELEDEGVETICMIQDYVRRIRSAYKQPDIRLELGEIVNEFKVFASIKDIPLLSAAQLNREASRTIEVATQANKADLVRLLGRSNIGESTLMLDNLDWASLINIEYDNMGTMYLGFNRIKMRIKCSSRSILYQPFVKDNSMKLLEDFYSPLPLFKETLRDNINLSSNISSTNNSRHTTVKDINEILMERKAKLNADENNTFFMSNYKKEDNSFVHNTYEVLSPISFV